MRSEHLSVWCVIFFWVFFSTFYFCFNASFFWSVFIINFLFWIFDVFSTVCLMPFSGFYNYFFSDFFVFDKSEYNLFAWIFQVCSVFFVGFEKMITFCVQRGKNARERRDSLVHFTIIKFVFFSFNLFRFLLSCNACCLFRSNRWLFLVSTKWRRNRYIRDCSSFYRIKSVRLNACAAHSHPHTQYDFCCSFFFHPFPVN